MGEGGGGDGTVRAWLVERTFSDDELNVVILVYATPDGRRALRKERAYTSFAGGSAGSPVSIEVEPGRLSAVTDDERRGRYAAEARRMARRHDPTGRV